MKGKPTKRIVVALTEPVELTKSTALSSEVRKAWGDRMIGTLQISVGGVTWFRNGAKGKRPVLTWDGLETLMDKHNQPKGRRHGR